MSRRQLPIAQARELVALAEAREMTAQSTLSRLLAQKAELQRAVIDLRKAQPDAETCLSGQSLTHWNIWRERELIRLQEKLAVLEIDLHRERQIAVRMAAELAVCEKLRDDAAKAVRLRRARST